ncbi:MAG: PIN domain-containing protein [Anaerolineae bacterium]|nr:PIN domain-containing protein [Anaerolineae bacterium]
MTLLLLDTNAISDLLSPTPEARQWATGRRRVGDELGICLPVYYEVLRGLLWRGATVKLRSFRTAILPLLYQVTLIDTDWEQAARFWAMARRSGKQLGDPDLLLAAIAFRLSAIIVSADRDFAALPVTHLDWRAT